MTASAVEETYLDAFGRRQHVAPEVRAAVLAAMDDAPDSGATTVAVVRPGGRLPVRGEVTLEDGTDLGRLERLPREVPFGYHRLRWGRNGECLLITGPGRCHLPADLRAWGWAIQLAAMRSSRSWGIGDLGDLRDMAAWSAGVGAGFVAVGPLGAPNPGPDPEPSPYYPSTRRWGNPLHLRVEELPGFDPGDEELADLTRAGRRLNEVRGIDRRRVSELKFAALERIRAVGAQRDAFQAWRAQQGHALERWARFAVLSERHGPGWQSWPEPFREPAGTAVRDVSSHLADRVALHAWIQWCFDRQLAAASADVRRLADMPVGVDPGGFDAWDWQEQLGLGATIGAPPDRFNAGGQDWGLPPFAPQRLRAARYRPFIDTIRAQLLHAGGLRIDHVLGLFRLWWIPRGEEPERGAYVRMPTDELLEIVAIESERAGAIVVGEDLGTVPPGVRRELRRRRLLSTRLVLFERVPPARYPRQSFAGVTTHDLPTIAGLWSGADLADQAAAGIEPDEAGLDSLRRRVARTAHAKAGASADEVSVAVHRRLAASPSMLVAATLEDALGVAERPNLPGTVAPQRANWSAALPLPLERIADDPRVVGLARALGR